MSTLRVERIGGFAISIFLCACNAGVNPSPASLVQDSARSSIASDAASAPLLYVSDLGKWQVYIYRFPSLKQVGKLTGFDDPQGECSDRAGNVWIANAGTYQMYEYAHGGTSSIATLGDPTGIPVGCAVDPRSGALAVTNLYDFSGAGSVLIYDKARGTPRIYSNPSMYYYYFDAYDRSGNLYVSGATSKTVYLLGVLNKRGHSISLISVKGGTLYFPGTVAWRSSALVLGDQHCHNSATSCFYELAVSGKTATIKRTIPLSGSCDVVQAWVGATQIVAGDSGQYCNSRPSRVEIWQYPVGGKPTKSIASPNAPVGTTLSSAGRS